MTEAAPDVEVEAEIPSRGTAEWYDAMGKAISRRDHARLMIKRWEDTLRDRESDVELLADAPTTQPDE